MSVMVCANPLPKKNSFLRFKGRWISDSGNTMEKVEMIVREVLQTILPMPNSYNVHRMLSISPQNQHFAKQFPRLLKTLKEKEKNRSPEFSPFSTMISTISQDRTNINF